MNFSQRLLRVAQLVAVGGFALMALAALLAARYGGGRSLHVHELPFALWGLASSVLALTLADLAGRPDRRRLSVSARVVVSAVLMVLLLVAVSGVLLAGHFLLWTASLQYTSIAASVLLVSLHPVMVSPLGWRMLGERTGARAVGGIGVAIIGTAITCAGDFRLSGEALGGDLLALGGAACLAGYLVIGRGVRYSIGVAPYSAAVYAVVAIVAAVTAVTQRTAHLPSARVAVLCLALAVVCTLGGHTVYNWALRRTQALKVSVAFLGEPPLAALLAAVCFGAIPPASTVIGGVLILAGIALTLRYQ